MVKFIFLSCWIAASYLLGYVLDLLNILKKSEALYEFRFNGIREIKMLLSKATDIFKSSGPGAIRGEGPY